MDIFNSWIIQDLLPKLPQQSVLIIDHASFHKVTEMKDAIQAAEYTLEYLPPYSPDLNPIEKKWAQAKKLRQKYDCPICDLFLTYHNELNK